LCQAFGDTWVGLGVLGGVFDFFTEKTALSVDLFDGEFCTVFKVGASGGSRTGQLHNIGELDRIGCLRHRPTAQQGRGSKGLQNKTLFHHSSPVISIG